MRSVMLVAAIILGSSPALAGEDPAILVCEAALRSALKSPKSYERVSADILSNSVFLIYDAVNSFNAPIRGKHVCEFKRHGSNFGFFFGSNASETEESQARYADMELAAGATGHYPVPSAATSLR